MKNPLQNLLIFFALSLCGLCAWQWRAQVEQRAALTQAAQANADQAAAIQGYTNSMVKMDEQIALLDRRLTECRDAAQSNAVVLAGLRQELAQTQTANATLQDQIRQANAAIRRQNDLLKEIAAQRDDFVERLNAAIKERNDIVTQYNEFLKHQSEK